MLPQRLLDSFHDLRPVASLPERLGGDDVGIVRAPMSDADGGVFADYFFETNRPRELVRGTALGPDKRPPIGDR